jgi:cold shock CspA family protein
LRDQVHAERHQGEIMLWNAEKGWGFIWCTSSKEIPGVKKGNGVYAHISQFRSGMDGKALRKDATLITIGTKVAFDTKAGPPTKDDVARNIDIIGHRADRVTPSVRTRNNGIAMVDEDQWNRQTVATDTEMERRVMRKPAPEPPRVDPNGNALDPNGQLLRALLKYREATNAFVDEWIDVLERQGR